MAVLPAEIPTGLVTGQYYFVNEDNIDADTKPELTIVTGTVSFTSSVKTLRMPSKKAVLVPLRFDAEFDSQGNLKPVNGTGVGVELPATNSPLLTEQDYTWRVEFNLKEAATDFTVNLDSFDIQVPVGSTQDLSVLMPVDSSPGTITIQGGPQGDKGDQGDIGPTPNVSVGTVVTGAPNVIVGPQGDKGVKGDPGGITTGSPLSSRDLNEVVVPGLYRQDNGPMVSSARNYPVSSIGTLMVFSTYADNTRVHQFYYPMNSVSSGAMFYARQLSSGGVIWSPWRSFNSTRVDQTAGRAIYQWDDVNNREQLVYGDTGWRELTPANGWTATSLAVRRTLYDVTIKASNINGASATSDSISPALPGGFRAAGLSISVRVPIMTSTSVDATRAAALDISSHTLRALGAAYTGITSGQIITSYPTTEPWPTVLPGTAAGTVPNL